MAKIKLSPIITEAHGRIGNDVYYFRNGLQYSRVYVKGSNPNTGPQKTVRRTFGDAVRSWQGMSLEERFKFNRRAIQLNMSGYNLFISRYMRTKMGALSVQNSAKECPKNRPKPDEILSPPFPSISLIYLYLLTLRDEYG